MQPLDVVEGTLGVRVIVGSPALLLRIAVSVAIAFVSACAPGTLSDSNTRSERQFQQDSVAARLERIYRGFAVGEPILIAAGRLCARTVPSIGARLAAVKDFPASERGYARSTLKVNEFVRFIQVVEGLAAHQVGLKEGDIVSMVNGVSTLTGAQAWSQLQLSGPNRIRLRGDRRERTIEVKSRAKCDYPLHLPADRRIAASADGARITLTSALMGLLEDDDELAMAIAHSIAHNVLRHAQTREASKDVRRRLAILLEGTPWPDVGVHIGAPTDEDEETQELERQADVVGLVLVERAGFDVAAGASFLRTLATQDPTLVASSRPPGLPEREANLSAIADEIRRRMAAGELPGPIRTAIASAEPSPEALRAELPAEALHLAEQRGILLGRAMDCRLSSEMLEKYESTSHDLLSEATYGRAQLEKAVSVFEQAIALGTKSPDTHCHFTAVEFYKGLDPP
jgi:hypothetical protein